jgi:hypothetical protein
MSLIREPQPAKTGVNALNHLFAEIEMMTIAAMLPMMNDAREPDVHPWARSGRCLACKPSILLIFGVARRGSMPLRFRRAMAPLPSGYQIMDVKQFSLPWESSKRTESGPAQLKREPSPPSAGSHRQPLALKGLAPIRRWTLQRACRSRRSHFTQFEWNEGTYGIPAERSAVRPVRESPAPVSVAFSVDVVNLDAMLRDSDFDGTVCFIARQFLHDEPPYFLLAIVPPLESRPAISLVAACSPAVETAQFLVIELDAMVVGRVRVRGRDEKDEKEACEFSDRHCSSPGG